MQFSLYFFYFVRKDVGLDLFFPKELINNIKVERDNKPVLHTYSRLVMEVCVNFLHPYVEHCSAK